MVETSWLGHLRRFIFGISPLEATFSRRGFANTSTIARERLEHAGQAFVMGYDLALRLGVPDALECALDSVGVSRDVQGFAVEGAAMAFMLMDLLTLWDGNRFSRLLDQHGERHVYMIHVGAGWAYARLRRPIQPKLQSMDPLLRWLAVDGYGFHEGYFHWPRTVTARQRPRQLVGYMGRAFDQGIGRSLWFIEGASPVRIEATIASFPEERRADLWGGAGLACAYAGGGDEDAIVALRAAARGYAPHAAQGAAFAAKARERAGNLAPHTDSACRILCGCSAREAAAVTDASLQGLPEDAAEPAYEIWRSRIRSALSTKAIRE